MGKDIFLKDGDTPGKVGQCKYIAIMDSEGPGKKKKDSEHKEISLPIDIPDGREQLCQYIVMNNSA